MFTMGNRNGQTTYSTGEVVRILHRFYDSNRSIYEKLGQLRRGYTRRWRRRSGEEVVRDYDPLLEEERHYVRDGSEIRYTLAGLDLILATVKKVPKADMGEASRATGERQEENSRPSDPAG